MNLSSLSFNAATPFSQDELIDLLQAAFLRNGNEAVSVYELSRSLEQGGHSTLYKAKTRQLPADLAIKLCLPEHEDELAGHVPLPNGLSAQSATRQKDDLLAVWALFADDSDYAIPQVYDLLTDQGILITEWIEGSSLRELLLNWRLGPRRALKLLEQAGIWLRRFHAYEPMAARPLDCAAILESLRKQMDATESDFARNVKVRTAIELLTRLAPEVGRIAIPRVWIHGDFHAGNLMVTGSRICGIDVSLAHKSEIVRDLAPFLNHMMLLAYHPVGLRMLPWRERLAEAFLAGYCHDGLAVTPRVLTWVRLSSILVVWMQQEPGWTSWPKRYYANWSFEHLTGRLCRQLAALN